MRMHKCQRVRQLTYGLLAIIVLICVNNTLGAIVLTDICEDFPEPGNGSPWHFERVGAGSVTLPYQEDWDKQEICFREDQPAWALSDNGNGNPGYFYPAAMKVQSPIKCQIEAEMGDVLFWIPETTTALYAVWHSVNYDTEVKLNGSMYLTGGVVPPRGFDLRTINASHNIIHHGDTLFYARNRTNPDYYEDLILDDNNNGFTYDTNRVFVPQNGYLAFGFGWQILQHRGGVVDIDLQVELVSSTQSMTVPAGMDQTISLIGGLTDPGGVTVTLPESTAGKFSAHFEPLSQDTFFQRLLEGDFVFDQFNYFIPGDELYLWDLDFTGELTEPATVTLNYGELDIPPDQLHIFHYGADNRWEIITPLNIDTINSLATFEMVDTSPYIIGALAPEPTTAIVLGIGWIGISHRTRRR